MVKVCLALLVSYAILGCSSNKLHKDERADTLSFSVSQLDDLEITSGEMIEPIRFSVEYLRDDEDLAEKVQVTAASNNQNLLPNSGIAIDGIGDDRAMTITPVPGSIGTATISLRATGGLQSDSATMTLTVRNSLPTISVDLADDRIYINEPFTLSFTVSDLETAVEDLHLSVASSRSDIIKRDDIVREGEGEERTLTFTPQTTGALQLEITAVDEHGGRSSEEVSFQVVEPLMIEGFEAESYRSAPNTPKSINFLVQQSPIAKNDLIWRSESDNAALVTDANIEVLGEGRQRQLRITPEPGQVGMVPIRLYVGEPDPAHSDDDSVPAVVREQLVHEFSVQFVDFPNIEGIPDRFTSSQDASFQVEVSISDPQDDPIDLDLHVRVVNQSPDIIVEDDLAIEGLYGQRRIVIPFVDDLEGFAELEVTVTNTQDQSSSTRFRVDRLHPPVINDVRIRGTSGLPDYIPAGETSTFVIDVDQNVSDVSMQARVVGDPEGLLLGDGALLTNIDQGQWLLLVTPAVGQGAITLEVIPERGPGIQGEAFEISLDVRRPPTITAFADYEIAKNATFIIPFEVRHPDADTLAEGLAVTVMSSDPNLGLIVDPRPAEGSSIVRDLRIVSANVSGLADIVVTVTDDYGLTASSSFTLTVSGTLPSLGEAVDAPELDWITGGDAPWFVSNIQVLSGTHAGQADVTGANTESWLQTEVTGPGRLSFAWQQSDDPEVELVLEIADKPTNDDEPVFQTIMTGEPAIAWMPASHVIADPGEYLLRWRLRAPTSLTQNITGQAWLDRVSFDHKLAVAPLAPIHLPTGTEQEVSVKVAFWSEGAFDDSSLDELLVTSLSESVVQVVENPEFVEATSSYEGIFRFRIRAQPLQEAQSTTLRITARAAENGEEYESSIIVPVEVSTESQDLAKALDNTELSWITGGDAPWFDQDEEFIFANDAAQSGAIGHNQESWFQTTIPEEGWISFYWRTETEPSIGQSKGDELLLIKGTETEARLSGSRDWRRVHVNVAANDVLRWVYRKDGSVSVEPDAAWVDWVVYVTEPIIEIDNTVDGVLATTASAGQALIIDYHTYGFPSPRDGHSLRMQWSRNQDMSAAESLQAIHLGDGVYASVALPVDPGVYYIQVQELEDGNPDPTVESAIIEVRVNF